jgi:hypothetical protein
MRRLLLGLIAAAALAVPASAATPATKLTITTREEGGSSPHTYTVTCGPAAVRSLPAGKLKPLDACRAIALAGKRLYAPRLSERREDCSYIQAPPRATITGYRLGRKVRTFVELGACERPLVPVAVVKRFVTWDD